jgi:bifunctional non-homologous end joining protein LigD
LSGEAPAAAQLGGGELKFTLNGVKLRGEFVLVHTRAKQWLLLKRDDEHTDRSWDIESVALDRSIVSGRTLSEIAAAAGGKRRTAGG